ncbi:MAG: cupredoxin domain-containing protein [Actinomycetota bacterium]
MRRRFALAALCLALAGALPACQGPDEREVRISISHSRFDPATVEVADGNTVRFVIENTDPIAHEFILGDPSVQDRHESGAHASHGAVPGEVSVPAGETATTTYTFSGPGPLIFGCHLPGHYAYGMRGEVRVA